jgi:hypothetical protein
MKKPVKTITIYVTKSALDSLHGPWKTKRTIKFLSAIENMFADAIKEDGHKAKYYKLILKPA